MAHDPVLDPSNLARAAERLGTLIPGYTGYKERERLRDEDRALREEVVRQLGLVMGRIERGLAACIRRLSPAEVEEADGILRALGRHRDRIRFAPAGYASLFARRKIERMELEGLLALDTALWAALEELDRVAAEWDLSTRHGESHWPSANVKDALRELEDVLDERESYLRS